MGQLLGNALPIGVAGSDTEIEVAQLVTCSTGNRALQLQHADSLVGVARLEEHVISSAWRGS